MKTPSLPLNHETRLERAALALDGLSVGDALGETCFAHAIRDMVLNNSRDTAYGPWPWTDDTAMALGIYEVLTEHGRIDQEALAQRFARRFTAQPFRGYGPGAIRLLDAIGGGANWRAAAGALFGGGSYGNGSAMRIAPLAGYFAEDEYTVVADQARLSAEITHLHPEGLAGGIAAAVAGAYAWKHRNQRADAATKSRLFDVVLAHTPSGEVRTGIARATTLGFELSMETAVGQMGNGSRISCQDTVPFCLWAAARHLDNYEAALMTTIRAGGDIDTNCAIVGGIVSLAVGRDGIPRDWIEGREELVV